MYGKKARAGEARAGQPASVVFEKFKRGFGFPRPDSVRDRLGDAIAEICPFRHSYVAFHWRAHHKHIQPNWACYFLIVEFSNQRHAAGQSLALKKRNK
jgi:hypothetical protein